MKKYGILGFPAKHSLSPAVHNAAFKKLKINAKFEIFEVEGKGLKSFFEKVREEPIYGLSVTAPYKETVIDYLDEIDEDARRIGAVNTVVNRDGVLLGYNTDFIGSNMALMEAMPEVPTGDNSVSVVFGAGGAARAVCYGLLKMGTNVWVVNRHKEKADQIAIEFAEMFEAEIHSGEWKELGTGDILVNTTSMWLNKDPYLKKLPSF
ncbi:shikimate dehydrogenase [Candidatus Peregrinibacteria bacterium]|nr:shikimate dehydrogenase [Candidatus Peregrinibacteria bacterium]